MREGVESGEGRVLWSMNKKVVKYEQICPFLNEEKKGARGGGSLWYILGWQGLEKRKEGSGSSNHGQITSRKKKEEKPHLKAKDMMENHINCKRV